MTLNEDITPRRHLGLESNLRNNNTRFTIQLRKGEQRFVVWKEHLTSNANEDVKDLQTGSWLKNKLNNICE